MGEAKILVSKIQTILSAKRNTLLLFANDILTPNNNV